MYRHLWELNVKLLFSNWKRFLGVLSHVHYVLEGCNKSSCQAGTVSGALLKEPNPSPHILFLALLSLSITSSIPIGKALTNNPSGNHPKTARARPCTHSAATTNSPHATLSKQNLANVLESGIPPHLSLSRFRDASVTLANAIYNTSHIMLLDLRFPSKGRGPTQKKRIGA
jgi:hypothetical protein